MMGRNQASLKPYTPTVSERMGQLLGDLTGSRNFGRNIISFLSDLTPIGNLESILYGNKTERQLSMLPIPGARKVGTFIRSAEHRRLSEALRNQTFDDVDFGTLSRKQFERLNGIRSRLGQEIFRDGNLVVPANVVRKLYEQRVVRDGMTPDQVADVVYSVFHSSKSRPASAKYPHIQALINAREILSNIGFIAANPATGDTVVKSAHRVESARLRSG